MALSDLTRDSVLAAIAEYDRLGRDDFLARHGFGRALTYLITHNGRTYDSKAISGVAHQYATGAMLSSNQFTGGDKTVVRTLNRLGFTVRRSNNPDWAWDEVVLACALVAANGWRALDQTDPRVVDLSNLLQRLPIHEPSERGETFRNPNGVGRKTADIATRHPDYQGRPTNGGAVDRAVLAAFLRQPAEMHRAAEAIRAAADSGALDDLDAIDPAELDDIDAPEGRLLVRRHLTRERNRALRARKIQSVVSAGGELACEVCGFNFGRTYGPRGEGYIECHHRVPLHAAGESRTRLPDLALICANCHRMIHRRSPWLSPEELRAVVDTARPPQ